MFLDSNYRVRIHFLSESLLFGYERQRCPTSWRLLWDSLYHAVYDQDALWAQDRERANRRTKYVEVLRRKLEAEASPMRGEINAK